MVLVKVDDVDTLLEAYHVIIDWLRLISLLFPNICAFGFGYLYFLLTVFKDQTGINSW